MFDFLKAKTDDHAKIISITDDTRVNPAGSTLSGMARNGQATQLAGTGDRYQVCFALSDGSQFQSTVTAKEVERYAVGATGRLTYRADAIARWEPERAAR